MPEEDNFRETQYYAMMQDLYGVSHLVSKTVYRTHCVCGECHHAWRGECMKAKCACCTTAPKP